MYMYYIEDCKWNFVYLEYKNIYYVVHVGHNGCCQILATESPSIL